MCWTLDALEEQRNHQEVVESGMVVASKVIARSVGMLLDDSLEGGIL